MSMSQALLPEFDQEMAKTRKMLERVPMDRFDWKPHEKSFSMGELANHVARLPGWGKETMVTESMDLAPEGGEIPMPPVVRTVEDLLSAFDRNQAGFRQAVADASDDAPEGVHGRRPGQARDRPRHGLGALRTPPERPPRRRAAARS